MKSKKFSSFFLRPGGRVVTLVGNSTFPDLWNRAEHEAGTLPPGRRRLRGAVHPPGTPGGRVAVLRDAAVVPLVHPARASRFRFWKGLDPCSSLNFSECCGWEPEAAGGADTAGRAERRVGGHCGSRSWKSARCWMRGGESMRRGAIGSRRPTGAPACCDSLTAPPRRESCPVRERFARSQTSALTPGCLPAH